MEGEVNEKLLRKGGELDGEELRFKDKLWTETKKMWVVAGPAIFSRFSTFGINVVSQAFIGHIGSKELAAYSLVFTVLLRFSNGILESAWLKGVRLLRYGKTLLILQLKLGMASALETLCGQAFGARHYHMLGVYLQRSWIVLILAAVLLLPLFFFTSSILKALGQEDYITEVSGYISLWLIPVMFSFIPSFTCQMFLQAQSKNMIISYLAALTLTIHVFLSWLLTVKYRFGIPGAMVSTILAYWIPNIGQLMFVTCGGCRETWKGFSTLAFKDLWPVIKLSLSSGVMLCLELWYNTVLVLLTGNLKNAEVAIDALSICLNINGWEMMISLGFLAAASVRVSNELGRGSSKAAKGKLAYIFTTSHEVASAVADLSPLLAFSILLNSVQPVLSGVAVGAGWQSTVAYINIASYYLVGIPIGVVLGYVMDMHVKGVWIGMLIGTFIQTVVLIIVTYRTDWEKQVIVAHNKINKWFVADPEETRGQVA
ncbi:hypothetical protein OIU84_017637 [Salix udensis]|uniref:Protein DETOXIFICATION n=1 Tax=Salix udensis TaxID=889485 RepID=A0AAD6PMP5_9ROSI|nr:hypothetical protein OIU84_017637 [Salix udensis]